MKYVKTKEDIPTGQHIAVLLFGTTYIPGDERSRTHPGHGYPESWEPKVDYIVMRDETELASWIQSNQRSAYVVLHSDVKTVMTQFNVKLV